MQHVLDCMNRFEFCEFVANATSGNMIVIAIVISVIQDGRLHSYLALGEND